MRQIIFPSLLPQTLNLNSTFPQGGGVGGEGPCPWVGRGGGREEGGSEVQQRHWPTSLIRVGLPVLLHNQRVGRQSCVWVVMGRGRERDGEWWKLNLYGDDELQRSHVAMLSTP